MHRAGVVVQATNYLQPATPFWVPVVLVLFLLGVIAVCVWKLLTRNR